MSRRVRVKNAAAGGMWWRVPAWLVVAVLVAAPQLAVVVTCQLYRAYSRDLPAVPDLDGYARMAPRSSRILAADGTILAELPFRVGKETGHRLWVPFAELPPRLVSALIAAEDLRFFAHEGVDLRAVVRATFANLRAGRTVEGASTITQQVARNLLPDDIGHERSLARKVREMILARRIERQYDKETILETYANHVFLGANAYGVAAAARAYFGKSLSELGLGECALLAGMAQAPGRADPYKDPMAARARTLEVLDRMARAGLVRTEEREEALARPLYLGRPVDPYGLLAPWMTERARREVAASLKGAYAQGGLLVETTVLPSVTTLVEDAVEKGTARLAEPTPQQGTFALDHRTGYVVAEVGGRSFRESQFDRTTQACRQPGSAFKPLVYAAALEKDAITPGTPLRDAPIVEYDASRDVTWKPTNSGRTFRGVALAQDALAASLNAPAVDVLDRVGIAPAIDLAARLGLSTPIAPVRPLVLGSSCVIPAELAGAYAVFATGGRRVEPRVVTRVVVRGVTAWDRASPYDAFLAPARRLDLLATRRDETRVLDEVTAFLMSSMLTQTVLSGTGQRASVLGRPVAGKTGTTNDNTDAWFVGYSGRVTAAVWVGHDDPKTTLGTREGGAHAALPLWVAAIQAIEGTSPPALLPGPPPGVIKARIDRPSGLLGTAESSDAVELYFRRGTEPTELAGSRLPEEIDRIADEF
jgi:penicillin-binding protein 1A